MQLANQEPAASKAAYTIPEAADRLTISRSSLYRLIDRGEIRRIKVGHRSVIPAQEIDRILAEGTSE